ncbi:phosphate acyltransferase PlsX [Algiphilus sp.]|uniref:phosphate acyltransferase PlsX n=2 Tax=Algiphilus sp. TaxID=1872431 RepID=UPI002A65DB06|nr:phosphate acyltransferase PlsX [Pseudomonadota bacterium]
MTTSGGESVRLAVDAMSGDNGIEAVVAAAALCVQNHDDVQLTLVGDGTALQGALGKHGLADSDRVSIQHASEVVTMDELPSKALRGKKDSSMRVAINLVRDGKADAAVSAGNTGALMGIARFVLKTLPGIDRPAIVSALPARQGHTYLLDLGANAACTPEQLFQFGVMGSVLARLVDGTQRPRVALLNIGEEEIKGVESIHRAQELLQASRLHYVGYVEANDLFGDAADVVVSDGFVGNVALKSAEGVAGFIKDMMQATFHEHWWGRVAGAVAWPVLKRLGARIDPRRYNGASLLGLRGVVIKSHGGADSVAFAHAMDVAIVESQQRLPARIGEDIARELGTDAAVGTA